MKASRSIQIPVIKNEELITTADSGYTNYFYGTTDRDHDALSVISDLTKNVKHRQALYDFRVGVSVGDAHWSIEHDHNNSGAIIMKFTNKPRVPDVALVEGAYTGFEVVYFVRGRETND